MNPWIIVALIAFVGFILYDKLRARLIEAAPLEEIVVTATRKPDLPYAYYFCRAKHPDITEHGEFFRCYRGNMSLVQVGQKP